MLRFCTACGSERTSVSAFCAQCGQKFPEDAAATAAAPQAPPSPTSPAPLATAPPAYQQPPPYAPPSAQAKQRRPMSPGPAVLMAGIGGAMVAGGTFKSGGPIVIVIGLLLGGYGLYKIFRP